MLWNHHLFLIKISYWLIQSLCRFNKCFSFFFKHCAMLFFSPEIFSFIYHPGGFKFRFELSFILQWHLMFPPLKWLGQFRSETVGSLWPGNWFNSCNMHLLLSAIAAVTKPVWGHFYCHKTNYNTKNNNNIKHLCEPKWENGKKGNICNALIFDVFYFAH